MFHSNWTAQQDKCFDWLKFNMKNKANLTVSVRILVMENIASACKACTYVRTLLRTLEAEI